MSHLAYPNLARLEHFEERGLNYSGIILDGWDTPTLLVHPLLLVVVLVTAGAPRGWAGWWCLLNCVIIHPMDYFVGALGIGPKYLLDEYAVLDTRYWVLKDPVVAWVSYQEFFLMAPLSYMWYRNINKNRWQKHFWALLTSTFQLMGTVFYLGCEWSDGFIHMPEMDWPPRFDTYLKLKYFWFVFIFLNGIWIVIPLYIFYDVYCNLGRLIESKSKTKVN